MDKIKQTKFIVTGGAGFVGSHLCEKILSKFPNSYLIIIDKLTYAGTTKNLSKIYKNKRVKLIKADIVDFINYEKFIKNADFAINVAAESHVDNSFDSPIEFTKTNSLGTQIFFQTCIKHKVKKLIHISSDEVYGENLKGFFKENNNLNPTNPYSASKAAAEMLINSYKYFYNKSIIIIRSNNMYGVRQYPEKLISKTITSFLKKQKMKIHGKGNNIRFYLSVNDFCDAVIKIITKKNNGVFNIGSNEYFTNNQIVKNISKKMNIDFKKSVIYVKDRLYNDRRYGVDYSKLKKMGWNPKENLIEELDKIIDWYSKNLSYFKKIK